MARILLLTAHSIAEYDDLRMLTDLGHDVFSIGAYTDPRNPTDDKRPALPDVRYHELLARLVEGDQMAHKAHLPDGLIDWADVIIAHHFVYDWIAGQWGRIRHKRVIWRTCGQTSPELEQFMGYLRPEGLQIVRYSPKEKHNGPYYAGEDALIRFGKYIDDWNGWTGNLVTVGNITQDMLGRADACGLDFWNAATNGLPRSPAGPRSEQMGGLGNLTYDEMRAYLRECRVYLYTGTKPAPYTLGLMEALLTGTPVVSIGPRAWGIPQLFEGHEFAVIAEDDPARAKAQLQDLLEDEDRAAGIGRIGQHRAQGLFGIDLVGAQWRDFLE